MYIYYYYTQGKHFAISLSDFNDDVVIKRRSNN